MQKIKPSIAYSFLIISGGSGFYFIFSLLGMSIQYEESLLFLFGVLVSSIAGGILWHRNIERKKKYSYKTASWTAFFSVLIGHYGAYYFLLVYQNICYMATGGCLSNLGDAPIGMLSGLWVAFQFMVFSIIFVIGWLSMSIAITLSMAYLFYRKQKNYI